MDHLEINDSDPLECSRIRVYRMFFQMMKKADNLYHNLPKDYI